MITIFLLLSLVYRNTLDILDNNPFSIMYVTNIFSILLLVFSLKNGIFLSYRSF